MSYDPDPGAIPAGIQFTRQLSQRDVSLQIPLNFVTAPGVVLTQACFAHKQYHIDAAAKCFSNLLAIGFQRFEFDIYWDATRQVWSLCPVELGTPVPSTNLTARDATSPIPNAYTGFDAADENVLDRDMFLGDDTIEPHHGRRQDSSSTTSSTATSSGTRLTGSTLSTPTSSATNLTSSSSRTETQAAAPTPTDGVYDIGPYSCSPSLSFQSLVNVLLQHLDASQTNVNATIKYMILDLHAAAPASDPTKPAPEPPLGTLPQGREILSYILDLSMAQYLYTPDDLADQRSDLNSSESWYTVVRNDEPDSAYFHVQNHDNGHTYTPNGWPSASFVELQRARRLFAGFGQIDPQMRRYNFSADKNIIFPAGYLSTSIINDGHLQGGKACFFDPNEKSVSANNNSWALAWEQSSLQSDLIAARNYTSCGISPVLNKTLNGVTADQEFEPYREFVERTIWSWALGQPIHGPTHGLGQDTDGTETQHRCAVLDATSGHWQSADCSGSHYNACRINGKPYEWSISKTPTNYARAGIPCPADSAFTAPRTALENDYLLQEWRSEIRVRSIDDNFVWLNFNDLDVEGCWVVGQNVTCPYLSSGHGDREIIVPVIAAIIVFVLAIFTMFVKCAANRQGTKRRRRRGDDGWDYEGVPS